MKSSCGARPINVPTVSLDGQTFNSFSPIRQNLISMSYLFSLARQPFLVAYLQLHLDYKHYISKCHLLWLSLVLAVKSYGLLMLIRCHLVFLCTLISALRCRIRANYCESNTLSQAYKSTWKVITSYGYEGFFYFILFFFKMWLPTGTTSLKKVVASGQHVVAWGNIRAVISLYTL